jgi:Repeat of unknown function (DUF346)
VGVKFLTLAAAVGVALTLAAPALASDANMSQVWNGSKFLGMVSYTEAPTSPVTLGVGEINVVTLSSPAPNKLTIKDNGNFIWSGWGWGQSFGCQTAKVADVDGDRPATCEHPNGIAAFSADLDKWTDTFTVDPSVPPGIALSIKGGPWTDQIDVHDGSTNDYVDCGATFDWVWNDVGDTTVNCETESLGEQLTSGTAVASMGPGHLDVFWRGSDGALWHKFFAGAGWSAAESLGGQITSDPAAVSWGPNRIDVFARGATGTLVHNWFDGGWHAWESLGGQLAPGSGPAVSSWGSNRLDVFWRAVGDDLRHRWFDHVWYWEESLGGQITSDPDAVSWGPNRIDIFARGFDGALWHRWFSSGWQSWETLGGQFTSGPGVESRGPNKLDVFARGMDGGLAWRSYNSGWTSWLNYAGRFNSDPAAASWGAGLPVNLFMRGPHDELYHAVLP